MGLFNSAILDVVIGLIFVYLLLAMLCTATNEWIATLSKSRAKMLKKGIAELLGNQPMGDDKGGSDAFVAEFYRHPLMTSMMKDGNHPAYISARTFSMIVTDLMSAKQTGTLAFADFEQGVRSLPEGDVKSALLALLQHSQQDVAAAQNAIEGWFNDAMDRVSGWYKRRTQTWTIIVALAITLLANADTIHIARRLWTDPVLRSAIVEGAKVRAQKPRPRISVEYKDEDDPTNPTVTVNEGNQLSGKEQELLGQVLGWRGALTDNSWRDWGERLLGWILTILALSLGAPFWFDMLNKFMNIRSSGKSPDEKAKAPEKKGAHAKA
ncbi:MAG TPA: hypothetical protein VGJ55_10885 [Pyrinomonadaceae bacterium]